MGAAVRLSCLAAGIPEPSSNKAGSSVKLSCVPAGGFTGKAERPGNSGKPALQSPDSPQNEDMAKKGLE